MMFGWFYWWWDSTGLARAQVVFSGLAFLVGIVLGFVAAWLANRQVAIAERQTAIAEKQDKIIQEQTARKADIRLEVELSNQTFDEEISNEYRVVIYNGGNKTCHAVDWSVALPTAGYGMTVKTTLTAGNEALPVTWAAMPTPKGMKACDFVNGHCSRPIFPGRSVVCCECVITYKEGDERVKLRPRREIRWYVETEDGRFPKSDYGVEEIQLVVVG